MAPGEFGRLLLGLAVAGFFLSPLLTFGMACWRERRAEAAAVRRRAEEDRILRRLPEGRSG